MQASRSSSRLPAHGATATRERISTKVGIRHGQVALALLAIAGIPCLAATFNVNSNADNATPAAGVVTLRSALAAANTAGGANVINVPAALGPYILTHGVLTTTNAANNVLLIQGTGGSAVIDGGGVSGVFELRGGTVSLGSLTVQHGFRTGFNCGAGINIFSATTVNITLSVIANNQALNTSGGGICVDGTLNLIDSTVSNNSATFGGGGIQVRSGVTHVSTSTINGNQSFGNPGSLGGAILNQATLTVTGSTISGNSAESGGAALYQGNREASAILSNVTIAGNSTPESHQLRSLEGANISLVSSIVANPVSGGNCEVFFGGTITSNGHNLDSGNTCHFAAAGDLINTDPVLGALQNNGGPTATMALLAGSKAIDHGANPLALATDQRGAGFARVAGAAADIGAFEARPLVVEYIDTADFPNSPGGHFFYTADAAEQAIVDGGGAGRFARTGKSFATGGNVRLCRFYGSIQPGPNSHFFTADQAECNALKAQQITPTPTTVQQWNYEGQGFEVSAAVLAGGTIGCPSGTQAVYRAYNSAFAATGKNPWDSNHRYSTAHADITALVSASGWRDEGIVFCAPQ